MKTYSGWLSSKDHQTVMRGDCPHCGSRQCLIPGPRGGLARNLLCRVCQMEFNAGPVGAQLLAERCPAERVKEVYGLVARCSSRLLEQKPDITQNAAEEPKV